MASSSQSLIDRYARLAIEEDERGEDLFVLLDNNNATVGDLRYSLVGRFLTKPPVNFHAMEHMMASIWQPVKGLWVKELGPNIFLF